MNSLQPKTMCRNGVRRPVRDCFKPLTGKCSTEHTGWTLTVWPAVSQTTSISVQRTLWLPGRYSVSQTAKCPTEWKKRPFEFWGQRWAEEEFSICRQRMSKQAKFVLQQIWLCLPSTLCNLLCSRLLGGGRTERETGKDWTNWSRGPALSRTAP